MAIRRRVVNEIYLWEFPIMQINFYERHKNEPSSERWRDSDRDVSIKLARASNPGPSATAIDCWPSGFWFCLFYNFAVATRNRNFISLMDVHRLLIKLICALNWPTVASNYHWTVGRERSRRKKIVFLRFDVSSDVNRASNLLVKRPQLKNNSIIIPQSRSLAFHHASLFFDIYLITINDWRA